MTSEPFEVVVEGELRPEWMIGLEVALEAAKAAGWTVETVVAHRVGSGGVELWRVS